METVCHPEQSEGSAFALAFLAAIPKGNLLLLSFSQENEVFLSNASFTGQSEVSENQTFREHCQHWTNVAQYKGVYRYLCFGFSTVSFDHITFVGRCVSRQSLGGTPSQFRKARPNEFGSSKPKR